MDTRTRIRIFAGSTLAVLAVVTGWGLSTDAGRHAGSSSATMATASSAPATASVPTEGVLGDDVGESD